MRFTKVIGKCDPKIVREAEEKLSAAFTELSLGYDNKSLGKAGIGGDPLVFQLVYPLKHYCDALALQNDDLIKKIKDIDGRIEKGEIIPEEELIPPETKKYIKSMDGKFLRTAATDGRAYYWNPEFINKQNAMSLRIIICHESTHSLYAHPSRRGSRMHKLFNIAVDFKVNFLIMQDFKARDIKNPAETFSKNLGEFIYLQEYADFLKDPFNPPPRLAHFNPTLGLRKMADPAYQDPFGDMPPMYYADDNLSDDMKRPENIYEYLYNQIPKCPKCGKLGMYKKPEEYKALEKKIKENEAKEKAKKVKEEKKNKPKSPGLPGNLVKDNCSGESATGAEACDGKNPENTSNSSNDGTSGSEQQAAEGENSCCSDGNEKGCACPSCGGDDSEYINPFIADTMDDHIDGDVSEDELIKRLSDAAEIAKRMGGKVSAGIESELSSLVSPKLRWEDLVRIKMQKRRNGFGKSDWTRPKSRPMFAGLYSPKKRDHFLNILCGYDCSGSMSDEDIALGISQLQVIDERGEMACVPWEGVCHWNHLTKLKKVDKENLMKVKRVGGGGTCVSHLFNEYEANIGKVDMIIVITDSFLYETELDGVKQPKGDVDVLWLVTSHNSKFAPKFGRVFNIKNE